MENDELKEIFDDMSKNLAFLMIACDYCSNNYDEGGVLSTLLDEIHLQTKNIYNRLDVYLMHRDDSLDLSENNLKYNP